MIQRKPSISKITAVQRYGLAVLSVATALGTALLLGRYHFREVEFPLFLFAIALTVWYAGIGPTILAVVLSSLVFNYFFTEPIYSFFVTTAELAYYIAFILFALLIIWFSTVRRRVERELLQSRDELEKEVTVRTQQASLLNLTHDTIFVRDMNDIIASWNRGAQELYGWTAEEAIGKNSHQLLHTVFPVPIGEIQAELLRTGRWEGELEKTKADGTRVVVASRWSLRRNEQESPVAIGGFAGKKFVAPGVVIWTCVGRWSLHTLCSQVHAFDSQRFFPRQRLDGEYRGFLGAGRCWHLDCNLHSER
jgi:PAS domain S-box-containing protein